MKTNIQVGDEIFVLLHNNSNYGKYPITFSIKHWNNFLSNYEVFKYKTKIKKIERDGVYIHLSKELIDLGYFSYPIVSYGCFKLVEPVILQCQKCDQCFEKYYFEKYFYCYSCSYFTQTLLKI